MKFVFNYVSVLFVSQLRTILSITLIFVFAFAVQAKNNLTQIQRTISEQQKKLAQQKNQQNALMNELKTQEFEIAQKVQNLSNIKATITTIDKQIAQLEKEIAPLDKKQAIQKKKLAEQISTAFKIKKANYIDLVLNPQIADRNQRIFAYFDYFNRQRENTIKELQAINQKIIEKKNVLEKAKKEQQALYEDRKNKQSELVKKQMQRRQTLNSLQKSMKESQIKIDQLKKQGLALKHEIDQAAKNNRDNAAKEQEAIKNIAYKEKVSNYKPTFSELQLMARSSGLGSAKKQYPWPVTGSILYRFGESINKQLSWKGLVIKTPEGTAVRAIAPGKVIMANWLEGYGFIVAIDHGKGDMTLYGYNQLLAVKVGKIINQGDVVAYAGDTGGQATPSVYFEIRRDGQPLNPISWLK